MPNAAAATAATTDATDKTTTTTDPTRRQEEEEDDDGLVRSEMHQAAHATTANNTSGLHLSTYRFTIHEDDDKTIETTTTTTPLSHLVDEDGDFLVPRRCNIKSITIKLHHHLATSLDHVGLQCWRGALLLCETLLSRRKEIAGKVLCELGAGVGIASILAARLQPRRVYLTDKNDAAILDLARQNVALNVAENVEENHRAPLIKVLALDWSAAGNENENAMSKGEPIDILLAADVIYDDEITDAFFQTLRHMLYNKKLTTEDAYCLLTLEKRTVFSLEAMATVAHGYARFCHHFQEEQEQESSSMPLVGTQVSIESIPLSLLEDNQGDGFLFSSYRAEVEMEVWEIRRCAPR